MESNSKCVVVFLKHIHDYDDGAALSEGEYASRCAFIETLLAQVDTIAHRQRSTNVHVLVVATATKYLKDCFPTSTFLRHFGAHLTMGLPQDDDRKQMLSHYLADECCDHHSITPSQMFDLAAQLEGWSGSEIKKLTQEAALAPLNEYVAAAQQKRRQLQETGGTLPVDADDNGEGCAQGHVRPVNMDDFANTFTV